jgi:putative transposase
VSAALPWLYLKGISTGDMSEALSVLLGEDAKGVIGERSKSSEGAVGR